MYLPYHEALYFSWPKKYFSILVGRDHNFEFLTERSYCVQKHPIRYTEKQDYYCGKLNLPKSHFSMDKNYTEYKIIKLNYPIRLRAKGWWGTGYLLFIKCKYEFGTIIEIKRNYVLTCLKQKNLKLLSYERFSKGKKYISNKVYLPRDSVGNQVYFLRFKPKICLNYGHENVQLPQFKGDLKDEGRCFLIFEKRNRTEIMTYLNSIKSEQKTPKYQEAINLIRKDVSPKSIARLKGVSETAIWKHIATAYNKKYIERNELAKILNRFTSTEVKINLLIDFENLKKIHKKNFARILKYFPDERTRQYKLKQSYSDTFNIKFIHGFYFKKYGIKLITNQVECMLLFYYDLLELDYI
jgi:hypothetical protein